MAVDVIVAVDVIGPVIVAVHVHGNDTVVVIRPVGGKLHNRPRTAVVSDEVLVPSARRCEQPGRWVTL